MSIENMFAPDPQFRQGQYQKLSDNANEWEGQIYSTLAAVIPSRLGVKTVLHWQKIDDNQGYAIGSVVISDKSDKSVGVPIIIKQWHLAPLDTVMSGDKAFPLTSDTLKEIFGALELGTDVVDRWGPGQLFDSGSMYENTYPPVGGGRYVYSSEQSLLNSIADTLWEEDIEYLRDRVAQEPEILAAMEKNGSYETICKLAKVTPKQKRAHGKKKHCIFQVRKDGINEFRVLGNPDAVFDPLMHSVDRPTMRKFVSSITGPGDKEQSIVSKVDKDGEVMLHVDKEKTSKPQKYKVDQPIGQHGEIFLYTEQGPVEPAVPCNEFGVYGMKDSAGVTTFGYVFPNVVNFDGKKQSIKIFAGKNASAIQERFSGNPEPNREIKLPESEPDLGKVGFFAYIEDGKALATTPFRVTGSRYYTGTRSLTGKDYSGKDVTLVLSDAAEGITKINKSKDLGATTENVYVIPSKMKFVELGNNKKLTEVPTDYNKYAALDKCASPLKILRSNGRFIFKGADLNKYASKNGVEFDFNWLDESDAKFLLASFGCPMEKISQAIDLTNTAMEVQIYGLDMPEVAVEKQASLLERAVRSLRVDLIKEAALMDDAESVDTALSLGFINPDNINKFVEAIPQLKETLSILSKLTIASRLGMSNIPEEASMSATQNIMRVLDGLKKLGLIKVQEA